MHPAPSRPVLAPPAPFRHEGGAYGVAIDLVPLFRGEQLATFWVCAPENREVARRNVEPEHRDESLIQRNNFDLGYPCTVSPFQSQKYLSAVVGEPSLILK